mmetsp:Transcript_24121/g.91026  ORF Transcript_24121/g.91026 Transcript_24121/m.91026 type:complete len:268 (+) Transcript_24121:664-1467(+)
MEGCQDRAVARRKGRHEGLRRSGVAATLGLGAGAGGALLGEDAEGGGRGHGARPVHVDEKLHGEAEEDVAVVFGGGKVLALHLDLDAAGGQAVEGEGALGELEGGVVAGDGVPRLDHLEVAAQQHHAEEVADVPARLVGRRNALGRAQARVSSARQGSRRRGGEREAHLLGGGGVLNATAGDPRLEDLLREVPAGGSGVGRRAGLEGEVAAGPRLARRGLRARRGQAGGLAGKLHCNGWLGAEDTWSQRLQERFTCCGTLCTGQRSE